MDGFDTVPMPHHHYLDDGRLLCWYHTAATGQVEGFRLTRDRDSGLMSIDVEEGRRLLAADARGMDGRPLGPATA